MPNNCFICGCVKNCALYLDKIFENIKLIGSIFDNYYIIIAYDKSTDNSLEILKKNMINIQNMTILENTNELSNIRTENISNARNSILNAIKTHENYIDYKYFIMLDCDDVCAKDIDITILEKYIDNDDWDGLSFNDPEYYDIWALSIDPYIYSCWHWNETIRGRVALIMKNYLLDKLNTINNDELLECISAFNGFAIYKIDKFINCRYEWNIYKNIDIFDINIIRQNINEISSLINSTNIEDCEHRHFHLQAIKLNNAKIRISPLVLFKNIKINNIDLPIYSKSLIGLSNQIINSKMMLYPIISIIPKSIKNKDIENKDIEDKNKDINDINNKNININKLLSIYKYKYK